MTVIRTETFPNMNVFCFLGIAKKISWPCFLILGPLVTRPLHTPQSLFETQEDFYFLQGKKCFKLSLKRMPAKPFCKPLRMYMYLYHFISQENDITFIISNNYAKQIFPMLKDFHYQ